MESDQPTNLFGAPGSSAASSKKSSIDDIIDHLTADLQSYDGQYILLGQPTTTDVHSIWGPYDNTVSHAESLIPNTYTNNYNQYNTNGEAPLPSYLQNDSYSGWPNSGYMPFVVNEPNQNVLNDGNYTNYQQNGSFMPHEFDMYNHRDDTDFGRHHVIDNLAGNWEPTQNGTYSPFGNIVETQAVQPPQITQNQQNGFASNSNGFPSSSNGFQNISNGFPSSSSVFSNSSNVFGNNSNVIQKKRIVAEVRPMRPTYSDVLAKSVTQSPSTSTTNTPAKISTPVSVKKMDCTPPPVKTIKAKKGNGNNNKNTQTILKRQHSSGSEDLMCNNIKVTNNDKKYVTNENNSWSSLEDITKYSLYEDSNDVILQRSPLSSLNNKDNRKTGGRKSKSPQRIRSQPQPETLNNHKLINSEERRQTKKSIHINNNLQWGVGKQVTSSFSNEKKNNKSAVPEVCRKGTNNNKNNINHNNIENNEGTKVNKTNTKFVSNLTASQRKPPRSTKKRESSRIGIAWRRWRAISSEYAVLFIRWFLNLLWDVVAMSLHLLLHLLGVIAGCSKSWMHMSKCMLKNVWTNPKKWWQQGRKHKYSSSKKQHPSRQERDSAYNLPYNISLPATGEEAMKRLLACRGKDPYSILGVTKNCPDEVIKKYYKRQAVLVHPDKNGHPGAEEAFKILVHAFELIGEPERRKAYDRCILESHHAEEAWSELNNLLSQLHKKMEYAANTIRCTNCGNRHKRRKLDRPLYAARYCSQCKIHHSAREGDIWAESSMLGCVWRYYACMEGSVYDISDWASCQTDNLKHLKPNTHVVQYRIVVGKHKPSSPPPPSSQSPPNCSEPEFDNFLNSMYGHNHHSGSTSHDNSLNRNLRKKGKKKKL